jgi:hypothetical protein
MFRQLAALMHEFHGQGLSCFNPLENSAELPNLPNLNLPSSEEKGFQRQIKSRGSDPIFQSAINSLHLSGSLKELLLNETFSCFLPLEWGLLVLLRFAKVYHIRCEELRLNHALLYTTLWFVYLSLQCQWTSYPYRSQMQRLVILECIILDAGKSASLLSTQFLQAFRLGWRLCFEDQKRGAFTSEEVSIRAFV